MVQVNFARREICCKVVYCGPGVCGKTTNLQLIHQKIPDNAKGRLTSIATDGDRTLFFDLLPIDLGEIAGMRTRFQLYTVPGQVYYSSTRKLVLQGADGIIFVADSGPDRMEDNLESFRDLESNLNGNGSNMKAIPIVLQYNKRDLPNAIPVEELNAKLNAHQLPFFEAVAVKGDGVMQTLKAIAKLVIDKCNADFSRRSEPATVPEPPKPYPIAPPIVSAPAEEKARETSVEPPMPTPPPTPPREAVERDRPQQPVPLIVPPIVQPKRDQPAPQPTVVKAPSLPARREGEKSKATTIFIVALLAVIALLIIYFFFLK